MKKYLSLLIIPLFVLTFSGMAFGWGSTGGDGSDYGQLQETAVFFNNSGVKLVHGNPVVLDTDSSASTTDPVKIAPTAGTTLGACVERTSSADDILAVGVVKVASENQTPVIVVTRGPIDTLVIDSTDAITEGSAVGTSGTGTAGGGYHLGLALEDGDGTDGSYCYIWVQPTGTAD